MKKSFNKLGILKSFTGNEAKKFHLVVTLNFKKFLGYIGIYSSFELERTTDISAV